MQVIAEIIDWLSVKITVGAVVLCAITGSGIMIALSVIGVGTTIIYNGIRIYKELWGKK